MTADALASRYQSMSDALALMLDDDTLKLSLRQAHWALFDPWLDAGARYVPEQPNGGRHRFDPNNWPPGVWTICPPSTPPSNPGKHACHCEHCRHDDGPARSAPAGPRGYDPDCDGCNRAGGPTPDHTARHYREASQCR